jgi:phospholipase/carboxylesterase
MTRTPDERSRVPRRTLLRAGLAGAAAAVAACFDPASGVQQGRAGARLTTRPVAPKRGPSAGVAALRLGGERDGELFVPSSYDHDRGAPLALMLHGAGGRASNMQRVHDAAETHGVVIAAPDSRGMTWDAIRAGSFGGDVVFIDRVLQHVFSRCRVDPARIAIGGFSDGASYALSLGLANGDLFTHILAFSPGFIVPAPRAGRPRIFVSHGTRDAVLPIDRTSHVIVPRLERDGYAVEYQEFDGPHTIPPAIETAAFTWFVADPTR